jgi:lipoate-protein ligase A
MLGPLHVYDDLDPKSAALNMAVDEALLANASVPILRFYRWRRPALSFGYFGRYVDVADESERREIVRRWTGGGIVPHGDDLTYSVIIPSSHAWFERSSPEIYCALHEAIRDALNKNGIAANLLVQPAPKISEACFANAVRADIMTGDRKIAGAAHRRSRTGLLHQGSIQQNDLPERFRSDLAQALCERYEIKNLSSELLEGAAHIAETKYGTDEWLKRR